MHLYGKAYTLLIPKNNIMFYALSTRSIFLLICCIIGFIYGFSHDIYLEPKTPENVAEDVAKMLAEEKSVLEDLRVPIENSDGSCTVFEVERVTYKYGYPLKLTNVIVKEYSIYSDKPLSVMKADNGAVTIIEAEIAETHFWGNTSFKRNVLNDTK